MAKLRLSDKQVNYLLIGISLLLFVNAFMYMQAINCLIEGSYRKAVLFGSIAALHTILHFGKVGTAMMTDLLRGRVTNLDVIRSRWIRWRVSQGITIAIIFSFSIMGTGFLGYVISTLPDDIKWYIPISFLFTMILGICGLFIVGGNYEKYERYLNT